MHALINGNDLAFDDIGQGPAVVLVHDLLFCRKIWQPQVSILVEHGFRVIVPDLRGFGESESGYRPFSLRLCADDLVSLMHYLGIGRAVMIGMGMAGSLVLDIQRRYPHRLAALCLVSPSRNLAGGTSNDIQRQDLADMVREGHRLTAIDHLCSQLFSGHGSRSQQLDWEVQNWIEAVEPSVLAAAMTSSAEFTRVNSQHPALVLYGDRSIQAGFERGSDVNHETIAGAGHLINLERPDQVNRCLIDFLNWLSLAKPRHSRLDKAA